MKKCPYCAEEIQDEAVKCKHCGEFLDGRPKEVAVSSEKTPWFFKTSSLVVMFLVVGPLMLPAVWYNPKYSRTAKIVITVVVCVLTYALTVVTAKALKSLMQYYQMVLGGSIPL